MLIYLQMIESDEDKSKFEAIYLKYRYLMFSVANRILENRYDAEDAVHQAFVSILNNLEKIKEADSPETRAYVVIITENKAIDIVRTRRRFTGGEPEEALHGVEIRLPGDGGLADAMAGLSARYRNALLLRFGYGYGTRELARLMGMTESAVQKLIWRAKKALKKQLERGEGET